MALPLVVRVLPYVAAVAAALLLRRDVATRRKAPLFYGRPRRGRQGRGVRPSPLSPLPILGEESFRPKGQEAEGATVRLSDRSAGRVPFARTGARHCTSLTLRRPHQHRRIALLHPKSRSARCERLGEGDGG